MGGRSRLEIYCRYKGGNAKNVVRLLVIINALVILLDISLHVTEYTGHFYI